MAKKQAKYGPTELEILQWYLKYGYASTLSYIPWDNYEKFPITTRRIVYAISKQKRNEAKPKKDK